MQSDNVRHDHEEANEDGLDCFCQVFVRPSILTAKPSSGCYIQQTGGDLIFCDGECKKWLHVWSIIYIFPFTITCLRPLIFIGAWGTLAVLQYHREFWQWFGHRYHSTKDPRMPPKFICFDCRVHVDVNWELIRHDLYPRMRSKFKDLALFRHVLHQYPSRTNSDVWTGERLKLLRRRKILRLYNFRKHLVSHSSVTRGSEYMNLELIDKEEAVLSRVFLARLEKEGVISFWYLFAMVTINFIFEDISRKNQQFWMIWTWHLLEPSRWSPRAKGKGKTRQPKLVHWTRKFDTFLIVPSGQAYNTSITLNRTIEKSKTVSSHFQI